MARPEDANKSKFAPMANVSSAATPVTSPPVASPAVVPVRSGAVRPAIVNTIVLKGPHGIGLDISKAADGRTVIQRFKDMPDGVPNPALASVPPIKPGDVIIAVNDTPSPLFMETVKLIKSSGETVKLTLERS
jgi:hypothetical protein